MGQLRRLAVLWALAGAIVGQALARPATAPQASGEIVGKVSDAGGAGLPGVSVVVHPLDGAALPAVLTAADGTYRVASVSRGIYRVEFTLAGFSDVVRRGLVVLQGERFELNATLQRLDAATAGATRDQAAAVQTSGGLQSGEVLVRLETALGNIDMAVDAARAPLTAANFLKYVDAGLYNGGRFHRVTRPDNYTPAPPDRPMMEIIQGGINPARRSEGFGPIPLERTNVTGLLHRAGTVSMARGTAADTATSDIFILLDDQPSLDFGGKRFEDGQGGAAFGRVVAGLDVVRRIQQQPVQTPPRQQSLAEPVIILKAYRATK